MFLVSWWVTLFGMGWLGAAAALWLSGFVVAGLVTAALEWVKLLREGSSLLIRGSSPVASVE